MAVRTLSPGEKDPGVIVETVRQLAQGRSDAVGEVTIAISSLATTVHAPACGPSSKVFLQAQSTSSAALRVACGTNNVSAGQFVIIHSTTNVTPLVFSWVALG